MPAGNSDNNTPVPTMDVKTGQLMNPHNPEFLTKRPWYLQQDQVAETGPSLDHQKKSTVVTQKPLLTLDRSEQRLRQQREREQAQLAAQSRGAPPVLALHQWVEALKKNKPPYRICQIIRVHAQAGNAVETLYDLRYDDNTVERNVKPGRSSRPRIRSTQSGSRTTNHGDNDDEAVVETYDAKRDPYHGYDREAHNAKLVAKYEQRDMLRRKLRELEKNKGRDESSNNNNDQSEANNADNAMLKEREDDDSDVESDVNHSDDDDDDDLDDFVQKDQDAKVISTRLARQGGVGGAQLHMTARNLRIREDTAKYLRNLDIDSAYYDPKSRSMRDNPNPERSVQDADFAGDNVARITGDAVQWAATQVFCWDAQTKVNKNNNKDNNTDHDATETFLHPQANPSQAELLKKKFQTKATDLKLQRKKAVLDKYGGQEYLDGTDGLAAAVVASPNTTTLGSKTFETQSTAAVDRTVRFGVTTTVEEYDPNVGSLKRPSRATTAAAAKNNHVLKRESKYEEDIFVNGHSTVWGSYFHKGAFQWGYADDHSLLKHSYCTNETGRLANDEAYAMQYGTGVAGSAALAQAQTMLLASRQQQNNSNSSRATSADAFRHRSKHYGEVDNSTTVELRPEKLQDAITRVVVQQQQQTNEGDHKNKRKYNSMHAEVDVSEEDMEAYRLLKERKSDPMAAHLGSDELLEYQVK